MKFKKWFSAAIMRPNEIDEYPCDTRNRVTIPPYEEYVVKIRNLGNRRLSYDILIDGESVAGNGHNFVLRPYQTANIQRFLKGNLEEGRRFQALPIDHPEVRHKGSQPETGVVEIRVRREKYPQPAIITSYWEYKPPVQPWQPYNPWRYCYGEYGDNTADGIADSSTLTSHGSDGTIMAMSCAVSSPTMDVADVPDLATGEGSHSGQTFVEVDDFAVEDEVQILRFYIVAPKDAKKPDKVFEAGEVYCPECAAKRSSKTDRYCRFCGTRI